MDKGTCAVSTMPFIPEASKDVQRMRNIKEAFSNATFLILYRPSFLMEEYDYTEK